MAGGGKAPVQDGLAFTPTAACFSVLVRGPAGGQPTREEGPRGAATGKVTCSFRINGAPPTMYPRPHTPPPCAGPFVSPKYILPFQSSPCSHKPPLCAEPPVFPTHLFPVQSPPFSPLPPVSCSGPSSGVSGVPALHPSPAPPPGESFWQVSGGNGFPDQNRRLIHVLWKPPEGASGF